MGDPLSYSNSSKNSKTSNLVTGKKAYNTSLVASRPKSFAKKNYEQLVSLTRGGFGSSNVSNCMERPSGFTDPLLSTIQMDSEVDTVEGFGQKHAECTDGATDCHTDSPASEVCSESSSVQTNSQTSQCEIAPQILESEKWLIQLHKELENQGITLSERINENELRRFYTASNNDFSSFLASIKKTIRWRETYRILSGEELEMWSDLLFWHGSDMMYRPCLIVRLGVACRTLVSQDRPRFAQAVISQVEYGVLHLVDADNPRITVLVDCEGLSPLRIPMQMMRTCSSLLQDHFPNLLGCLLVIRLPAVVRVVAQTFIQVLKPTTRKKLKIEGEMYQKALSDFLPTLPSYLGGSCSCMKCSKSRRRDMQLHYATGTSSRVGSEGDISDNEDSPVSHPSLELDGHLLGNYDHLLRTAIISVLVIWVFIAFSAGLFDPSSRYLPL